MSTTTRTVPSLTLRGKSGATYVFNVYPLDTEFRPVPAVYAFTKADAMGKHSVIYIGQTGDLSERFDDHHKWYCITQRGANRICVHQEGSEWNRQAIERDLIANYDPPCNG